MRAKRAKSIGRASGRPRVRNSSRSPVKLTLRGRLEQALTDAAEVRVHQAATAEILRVISESPTDVQPVFDAITRSAAHLFKPCITGILMREGDHVGLHGLAGPTHVDRDAMERTFPVRFDPEASLVSRAIASCQVMQIMDSEVSGGPEAVRQAGRAIGFRSLTTAPLV